MRCCKILPLFRLLQIPRSSPLAYLPKGCDFHVFMGFSSLFLPGSNHVVLELWTFPGYSPRIAGHRFRRPKFSNSPACLPGGSFGTTPEWYPKNPFQKVRWWTPHSRRKLLTKNFRVVIPQKFVVKLSKLVAVHYFLFFHNNFTSKPALTAYINAPIPINASASFHNRSWAKSNSSKVSFPT